MKAMRIIMIALVLTLALPLVACGGGGGDVLKGTWSGTSDNGDATWEFDGNGKCKLTNTFFDKEPGTYTINSSTEVTITIQGWDAPKTYKYAINGSTLTLTPTDPYSVTYILTKK